MSHIWPHLADAVLSSLWFSLFRPLIRSMVFVRSFLRGCFLAIVWLMLFAVAGVIGGRPMRGDLVVELL